MNNATASHHRASRHESVDRCDTDGFVSQWASGCLASLAEDRAMIEENGGLSEFPGLYRRSDGARMRARLERYECPHSHYTKARWVLQCEGGSQRRIPDTRTQRGNLWRQGYEVRPEMAPAAAELRSFGAGACSVHSEVFRTDGGFPGNAVRAALAEVTS